MNRSNYYVKVVMDDKDGKPTEFAFHPHLYMLIKTGIKMIGQKRHFFGLITGNVGDGKSNMAANLTALFEHECGRQMSYDNIVWTTNKFIEKTDRDDNKGTTIWWDEAIQGATGKKVALTSEGEMLKISLVTKRFKRHFYILLVDEIEEYSWKLIKMANFWLHCESTYGQRGTFKGYIKKKKIKEIYRAFKHYKWTWEQITYKPDIKGKFNEYLPVLFDEEEYDRKKLEETKVLEDKATKDPKESERDKLLLNMYENTGLSHKKIGDQVGMPARTVGDAIKRARDSQSI